MIAVFSISCEPAGEHANICNENPCFCGGYGALEILGQPRQQPSLEKARFTTHRRGRTSKPLALSDRLMISSVILTFRRDPLSFGPA